MSPPTSPMASESEKAAEPGFIDDHVRQLGQTMIHTQVLVSHFARHCCFRDRQFVLCQLLAVTYSELQLMIFSTASPMESLNLAIISSTTKFALVVNSLYQG